MAVAANLCAAAVGTETDGSIVSPASVNGIVGIKPTLGLVSRAGVVPIAHSQDTVGPMARTVCDAAILLSVLAGPDPADSITGNCTGKMQDDYTQFLDPGGLQGARIGVARKFFGSNSAVDELVNERIGQMRHMGAEIIDPTDLPSHGLFEDTELEVLLYEFKTDLDAYLITHNAEVRSLADIIPFNEKHAQEELPFFGQEIMIMAEKKGPLTEKAYTDPLTKNLRLARDEGIDSVMKEHRLDAILAPTSALAWLTDWVNGDYGFESCSPPCGHCRLSAHHCTRGFRTWSASRPLIVRAPMERTTHKTSIFLRASHKGST